MHIAILDDEPAVLAQVSQALTGPWGRHKISLKISTFSSCKELIQATKRHTFDLAILDWELPDGSGLEVLTWFTSYLESPPPVIMLTVRNSEQDVVEALTGGAEDFINKPFRARELKARAIAVLRRRNGPLSVEKGREEDPSHGNIVFDVNRHTLHRDGQPVKLTHQEYRLAFLLFSNLGRPLARAYLYEYVWGKDEQFSSRTLDVHIYRVRRKLGLTPEHGWQLNAVYGYGYRLQETDPSAA
ncbi:DNA-binding response regulator [Alcanivorax sp. KX64203]|jgi:two-component system, OmpR family, response regulator RegX3|nr:DNA-binding response regulator [Alcanivorax sp. KX64203]